MSAAPANPAQVTDAMVVKTLRKIAKIARELANDRMTPNAGLWAGCADDAEAAITAAIGAGGQAVAVKDWDIEATADQIARQLAAEVKSFGPTGRIHGETYNAAKAGAIAAFKCAVATLSTIAHPVQPGWREPDGFTPYLWQCKDYADGWISYADKEEALAYQRDTDCLLRVTYRPVAPQPKGE